MKRDFPHISKLLFVLLLIFGLAGCVEEDISPSELVSVSSPQGQFLLYSPDNSRFAFEISTQKQENNRIEYVRVLLSLENGRSFEHALIRNFPSNLSLSLREAVASIEQVELSELSKESVIKVKFLAKKENAGEEVLNTELDLPISCPAPGIAGTYQATTYGKSGPGGGGTFSDIVATIEITKINEFEFRISDASAGVFAEIWAAKAEPARLIENCRELSFPSFTDQFDDQFSGEAKLQADGSIELKWQTSYGDSGRTLFRK